MGKLLDDSAMSRFGIQTINNNLNMADEEMIDVAIAPSEDIKGKKFESLRPWFDALLLSRDLIQLPLILLFVQISR